MSRNAEKKMQQRLYKIIQVRLNLFSEPKVKRIEKRQSKSEVKVVLNQEDFSRNRVEKMDFRYVKGEVLGRKVRSLTFYEDVFRQFRLNGEKKRRKGVVDPLAFEKFNEAYTKTMSTDRKVKKKLIVFNKALSKKKIERNFTHESKESTIGYKTTI